ncbi:MAG: pyridoxal-phosphate dependent enzyme [Fluviicoccus sp.]|uniref:1-aminocyclopropane-1-carboxylate deaminase/D-cysteine desulfhydrase n=1 Tax=Fluviicoccus sp. TaxID=2003552 RepID=UPI0027185216|nr:pyridoxal-phosphate dependent enzyme [Fluviicoccus sp.]MDO8329979.1 pyridoxal-phosphate dependent enzyme [Fluviicoccus sp.]
MHPLLQQYPSLQGVLPCAGIAALPTPVSALDSHGQAWVKHDDLTHPLYGGNKIRKLEFIIGEWRQRQVREVITFGAVGTNAGLATALACHQEGIRCRVLLFDQPPSAIVRANLLAMQQLGAKLDYCGSLFQTALRFYLHPRRLLPDHYFLFAGCANPAATYAYVNAAFELKAQIAEGQLPEPEEIVIPVGSGSTLAGLTLGCRLAGMQTRVVGVRVAPARLGLIPACTPDTVFSQIRTAHVFLSKHLPGGIAFPPPRPVLLDTYYGPGYGESTPEALAAIRRFDDDHDIKLEQTYTGKAAACFLDRLDACQGPVLFWNTFNSRPMGNLPTATTRHPLSPPLTRILQT